jgi:predicted ATP-binding protein involved in virulence
MTFRLERLTLQNFRLFRQLEVDLDERLTVFVAENGGGKSALVAAVALVFEPFVDELTGYVSRGLAPSDVRAMRGPDGSVERALPAVLSASVQLRAVGGAVRLERSSINPRAKGLTGPGAFDLTSFADRLGGELRAFIENGAAPPVLPVVCVFGTARLWVADAVRRGAAPKGEFLSRMRGYDECLSAISSFPSFVQWFKRVSEEADASARRGATSPHNPDGRLEAVRRAVRTVLEPVGLTDLVWDYLAEELAADHPIRGRVPMSQLSDGIRIMIAVVADIAHRCVRLNPQFGANAAAETHGIVLIDEVDMHLHPKWQQVVLDLLLKAFPKVQFIVTTHSPQVLSSVDHKRIRVLKQVGNDIVVSTPAQQTRGVESATLLATLMGVDPVPPVVEADWLARYRGMIEDGLAGSVEAIALRAKLEGHFGAGHPLIRDCDTAIRFQGYRAKAGPRGSGA